MLDIIQKIHGEHGEGKIETPTFNFYYSSFTHVFLLMIAVLLKSLSICKFSYPEIQPRTWPDIQEKKNNLVHP